MLVEVGVEFWYRAHETNLRPNAQWSVRWPESAAEFRDLRINDRTRDILHYDQGRGALWRDAPLNGENSDMGSAAFIEPRSLLYFFRWHPGHNSALLANAHRPDVCLPATGWHQTGDYGVRAYQVAPNLAVPFRHFVFAHEGPGRTQYAHAFYCVWQDRVGPRNGGFPAADTAAAAANTSTGESDSVTRSMAGAPSAWSRKERIQAVMQGRRDLGQQVMEYLLIEPRQISAAEAEEIFAREARKLIVPSGGTRGEENPKHQ